MEWSAKSDVGLVRKTNEDSYIVKSKRDNHIIAIVADGMGGHQGGKTASSLTVDVIIDNLEKYIPGMQTVDLQEEDLQEEDLKKRDLQNEYLQNEDLQNYDLQEVDAVEVDLVKVVKSSIKLANDKVYKLAAENTDLVGMGTTIVVAVIIENDIIIAHVGDSRAYLLSGQKIMQLTTDHTLVNELFSEGKISESEALNHPKRNMITRAIGTNQHIDIDINKLKWGKDDILLLCTDGLSEIITADEILEAFLNEQSIELAVDLLMEKSLQIGGKDNITIIAVKNNKLDNYINERGLS